MGNQLVTLVRHAKSSWKTAYLSDYQRPLNERGFRDGPIMARRLEARHCIPDLLLCSAATRAQQTAAFLRDQFQLKPEQFELHEELYLASPQTILKIISRIPSSTRHVMLVAHNPGLEELSELLAGRALPPMPTLGIRHFACPSIQNLERSVLDANGKISDSHKTIELQNLPINTHPTATIAPASLLFDFFPKQSVDF